MVNFKAIAIMAIGISMLVGLATLMHFFPILVPILIGTSLLWGLFFIYKAIAGMLE